MPGVKQLPWRLLVSILIGLGCSSPRPIEGVWRPGSKPNATVGHLKDLNLELAKRVATEYCAWLYYTPEHKYEMSMLTDRPRPDDLVAGKKTCVLPRFVNDSRYKPGDLKYIFALHNHPFGKRLSIVDLHFIETMASQHDWKAETKNGEIHLSIIAFFSHSRSSGAPTCDGFHQYVPATRQLMTWIQTQDGWKKSDDGILEWIDDRTYRIKKI